MRKQDIRDISFFELCDYLKSIQQPSFRARQIFEWMYQKNVQDFSRMTNLPKPLRDQVSQSFNLTPLKPLRKQVSRDKTIKLLFALADSETVETVIIPTARRVTLCVSSQVGCKFACRFCASGVGGWKRNLTAGEILAQVVSAKKETDKYTITHIVFMGTGEPMDNYDNVLKAIRLLNSPQAMKIAARRITVSTCGLVPQIKKFAQEKLQVELSISLHGYDDASRKKLMPINQRYPLKALLEVCREYIRVTRRQITFEYLLIKDFTCTQKAARELGSRFKGMLCKFNLIPYNKVKEFEYTAVSRQEQLSFQNALKHHGIHSTIRKSRGEDIGGACGQLRRGV